MISKLYSSAEKKGAWLAVLSGLCYGLLGYFGVNLMRLGLSVTNLSFWRFFISFLFLAVIVGYRSKGRIESSPRQWLHAWLCGAVFFCPSGMLFFMASRYISTGQSMVTFFTYPAFVMLLTWVFYGQRIRRQYIISLLIILVGLVLLVDAGELSFDLTGVGLSVISAFSYAFYVLQSKKSTLPPLSSTMLVSLGSASTCLMLALIDGTFLIPSLPEQWFHATGIAIVCAAVPILLLLKAMRYISPEKASLLSVLEPVFTVLFGILLLDETVTLINGLGVVLTLLGAVSITIAWERYIPPLARRRSGVPR